MFLKNNQNEKSHGTFRVPWLTINLSFLIVGLYCFNFSVFELSVFDKSAIFNGQAWRLLTGHFVHLNGEHLFWDLVAFVLIGSVLELNHPKHFVFSLLSSCCMVSVWLLMGEPNLMTYCGLSGALNGMMVLAAMLQWKVHREKTYLCVLIFTMLKIIFETTVHQTIFTSLSLHAVPSAHAAGFISGVLYFLIIEKIQLKDFKFVLKLNSCLVSK